MKFWQEVENLTWDDVRWLPVDDPIRKKWEMYCQIHDRFNSPEWFHCFFCGDELDLTIIISRIGDEFRCCKKCLPSLKPIM